jgi:hypothetical protein
MLAIPKNHDVDRGAKRMSLGKVLIILAHALVGWFLCAFTMGIGMAVTTLQTTLIIHAIGAPVFFALVSLLYFRRFHYTSPLLTAVVFVGFVMIVDFFVIALLINRSLSMFGSWLGTWLPFFLIFGSTLLTGTLISRTKSRWASESSQTEDLILLKPKW